MVNQTRVDANFHVCVDMQKLDDTEYTHENSTKSLKVMLQSKYSK